MRRCLFRGWRCEHPGDPARHAAPKRDAVSSDTGGSMMEHDRRTQPVGREILDRMFRAHGML